ncbi:hypothetical protein E2C01_098851 [Portunus trituberculatus]|uniref:Uncharacterized protein n=1 Tax=Portunus trituberculatus TaxID=210409 RepID=A0A5B7K8S3_PORTR|nr:hypothetical protein [Portunus trituberculatus]
MRCSAETEAETPANQDAFRNTRRCVNLDLRSVDLIPFLPVTVRYLAYKGRWHTPLLHVPLAMEPRRDACTPRDRMAR